MNKYLPLIFAVFTLLISNSACQINSSEKHLSRATTTIANNNNKTALGIGLSGINYWSTQIPFLDYFKSASPWITQCIKSEPDCQGTWSTDEDKLLNLDENGWVKSLPSPEDSPQYTHVSTLLFRDIDGHYPAGKYIVLYEGEGTIEYNFAAKKIGEESRPGRDIIEVNPKENGIMITITATDPKKTGNYIRNIRVIHSQNETLYQKGEIFNPVFIDKIKDFKALRFMDWMNTNNSPQKNWQDRPKVTDYTYMNKGVPLEIMIALANKIKADPWFNIPHQATDEYITNFANMVKAKLDPNLKVYIELSNEVWNWQFSQAHYALKEGQKRWGNQGDAYMQWYGMRVAQTCDIWDKNWGNKKDHIICIMGTQTGWKGLENSALDCSYWVAEGNKPCYQHGIDAYAIAGYFGGDLGRSENIEQVKSWLNSPDGGFNQAIQEIKEGGLLTKSQDNLPANYSLFLYHAEVARKRGLKLVAYEGGQHIVGTGEVKDNQELNNFYINLNRHPEMYNIYTQLLNDWQQAGGTLFMHFVDVKYPNRNGSWGALEYLDQPGSPKYNALSDFSKNN